MPTLLLPCLLCLLLLQSAVGEESELEIVEGPSRVIETYDEYTKREQGSSAFACTELDIARPWLAYQTLESYLLRGNVDEVDLTEGMVLYPLQEHYGTEEIGSDLCIYLQREHHCYPPDPSPSLAVEIKKSFEPVTYYGVRYWGQSSTARTTHYATKLMTALDNDESKKYVAGHYVLSFHPNHVREVRVNAAQDAAAPETISCEGEEIAARPISETLDFKYGIADIKVKIADYDPCVVGIKQYDITLTDADDKKISKTATPKDGGFTINDREVCSTVSVKVEAKDESGDVVDTHAFDFVFKTHDVLPGILTSWKDSDSCVMTGEYPANILYSQAEDLCTLLDAHLYDGRGDITSLYNTVKTQSIYGGWVDLKYDNDDGAWKWGSNAPFDASLWSPWSQIDGSVGCVYLNYGPAQPQLIAEPCTSNIHYMCIREFTSPKHDL